MKINEFEKSKDFKKPHDPVATGIPVQSGVRLFPLGNVRFRSIWKKLDRIFHVFLIDLVGSESLRSPDVTNNPKIYGFHQNH